ncbi:MAG: hypothetical protein JW384_03518 [Nitrosomonadaceae bacterium]|nr:hypothetical protein [Nitrosomonadaceae bacterium]
MLIFREVIENPDHLRSCDHTFIQRSKISLLVTPKTTPDRLGVHSIIPAEEYPFPPYKAPRLPRVNNHKGCICQRACQVAGGRSCRERD